MDDVTREAVDHALSKIRELTPEQKDMALLVASFCTMTLSDGEIEECEKTLNPLLTQEEISTYKSLPM